ncbi:MAG TPA: GGDEF domain-containing protein [Anaerolineae bacterium]|nr:GGDEF domain-containing protein [Anaerolineae bacterium]
MTEKNYITDIEGLSLVFIEIMKEMTDKGASLNVASLKKILGKREDIKNLIHASNYMNTSTLNSNREPKSKKVQSQDKSFKPDINLKSGKGEKDNHCSDSDNENNNSIMKKIFKQSAQDIPDIRLKRLKDITFEILTKLQTVFGIEYHLDLSSLIDRIRQCDNVDSLIDLQKKTIGLIEDFIQYFQTEKEETTLFLKKVGEKLSQMENDLIISSDKQSRYHEIDFSFAENLKIEIKALSESAETINTFEDFKSFVASNLERVTSVVDKKQKEYSQRGEYYRTEREKLLKNFEKVIDKVGEQIKILEEQSSIDPLTGIFNRRIFQERIDEEIDRFHRYQQYFSLIFFDIDHFKDVNDRYGHKAGDIVLKVIAQKIKEILRKPDILARYGGEEFVVILPETNISQSLGVAKKVREIVEKTEFHYEGIKVPITISVGVTEVQENDSAPSTVITRADMFMYTAKENGRNLVVSDLDIPDTSAR